MKLMRVMLGIAFAIGVIVPVSGAVKKGPYLIYEGNNTAMTVLWQLDNSTGGTVQWGLDMNYTGGQATTSEYGDHQHKYTISGLQPGTKYYYNVVGVGSGSFCTAPAADAQNVKLLAYGDSRDNPSTQSTLQGRMINLYTNDQAFQSLCLHSADWVGTDDESNWTNDHFNRSYANILKFHSEIPINGSRGNHEGAASVYKKYYPYPYVSGSGCYWSYDYGPVHVSVVDVYAGITSGSAQHSWLQNDLATSSKPWKFIVLHEPGWGAGTHSNNTSVQNYIQPLCKTYGVAMVIAGHNHNYVRAEVDGVYHITTGGGGASLYTPSTSYPNVKKVDKSYHYSTISIQGTVLTFSATRSDGSTIETFQINRTPDTTPPAVPTGLVADAGDGSVQLDWNDNGESDLASYSVYRRVVDQHGDPLAMLATGITTSSFTDDGVTNGQLYYYAVSAKDQSGNESGLTAEVPATPEAGAVSEIYVNDITLAKKKSLLKNYATASVWIKDDGGANVPGVAVYASWSGFVSGNQSATTGSDGKASFTSPKKRGSGTITFTVTDAAKTGCAYNPDLNVETSASISVP